VPSAVCLALVVLLAGLSVVVLGYTGGRRPEAANKSQHGFVASLAHGLDASVRRSTDDLAARAAAYDADTAHDAPRVTAAMAGEWQGAAVIDLT
jgi:hypothetical protein